MGLRLQIAAIITIFISIIGAILRFSWGDPYGALIFTTVGIVITIVFFALARIIENQESILEVLQEQEEREKRRLRQEKKECTKCGSKYDLDYGFCPYCGYGD